MSVCQKCKNALYTHEEEKRHRICFKCVPNGIEIISVKEAFDKFTGKMVVVVKTKELLHKRVTPSLFSGEPAEVQEVYKTRKYFSK